MTIEELKAKIEAKKSEYAALNAKQNALKVFLNSGYGAASNVFFRYFDLRVATSITVMGQVCVRGVANYVEQKVPLITNISSDTDSDFFRCDKIVEKKFGTTNVSYVDGLKFMEDLDRKIISPKIKEFYVKLTENCNAIANTFEMENEVIGDKGLFLGKKKYAIHMLKKDKSVYTDEPKLKITGIEVVRTSTPQPIRDELRKALHVFFKSPDRDSMMKFMEGVRTKFDKMEFTDIAFPRSVNEMEKYTVDSKSLPIAVRAALVYNQSIKDLKLTGKHRQIYSGDKIKFAYIKVPNKFRSNVIGCPDDMMPEKMHSMFEIDYDTQFEKTFEAPLAKIFEAMGWNMAKGVTSLEDFFS